jgi:hypothetical protein
MEVQKMNPEQFEMIMNKRQSDSRRTMIEKAREYAHKDDRLHNFKRAAALQGCTPSQALWGMAAKHIISVQDMVFRHTPITEELLNEKIGDIINYLHLVEATLREEAGLIPKPGENKECEKK